MTLKREPGRPPGTKDPEDKSVQLWLAVHRRGPRPRRALQASAEVAADLAARGQQMSPKHVLREYQKVEKQRLADTELARKLNDLVAFDKSLWEGIGPGDFTPNAFPHVRYVSALGKFFRWDDPFARRVRETLVHAIATLSKIRK